jgi:hypothetical protein
MRRSFGVTAGAVIAGLVTATDVTFKIEGESMMAKLMSRMGSGKVTSETTNVDTAAIADSEFAPPAGYKIKTQ